MKAILHRHRGHESSGKGIYDRIVLADDPNHLVIDVSGADFVKVTRQGPKIAAIARVREEDYVTLEE